MTHRLEVRNALAGHSSNLGVEQPLLLEDEAGADEEPADNGEDDADDLCASSGKFRRGGRAEHVSRERRPLVVWADTNFELRARLERRGG